MLFPRKLPIIWTLVALGVAVLAISILWWGFRNTGIESPAHLPHINTSALFAAATAATERDEPDVAQRLLNRILAQQPEHHQARLLLGQLLWNQQDQRAFQEWARVPVDAGREFAIAKYLAGAAHLDIGKAHDAEVLLLSSMQHDHTYFPPINALLNLYAVQRRPPEIRRLLAACSRFRAPNPRDLAFDLLAGKELFSADQSLRALQKIQQTEPQNAVIRYSLASVYREAGELQNAVRQLTDSQHAPQADLSKVSGENTLSSNTTADAQLGLQLLLCMELRLQSDAAKLVRQIVVHRCTNPNALYALGVWCLDQRNLKSAIPLLKAALSHAPFDAAVWNAAGQATAQAGDSPHGDSLLHLAVVADNIERDAYLVLRGTGDSELLAATMHRVAKHLRVLQQHQRATVWEGVADNLRLQPPSQTWSSDLAQYIKVLIRPIQNPALKLTWKPKNIWDHMQLQTGPDVLSETTDDSDSMLSGKSTKKSLSHNFRLNNVAETIGVRFQYNPGSTGKHLIVETIGGGVCVLDYDGDSHPDVFFPQGSQAALMAAFQNETHDNSTTAADGNRLFKNLGNGVFKDVSIDACVNDTAYSLGCACADIDNDGDTDIVVGSIGSTMIYRNNSDGTFLPELLDASDQSVTAGIGVGDFDNNGAPDIWLVRYVDDWKQTCLNASQQFSTCLPITFPAPADLRLLSDNAAGYVYTSTDQLTPERGRGLGIVTIDLNNDLKTDIYVANDGTANQLYLSSTESVESTSEVALVNGCALSGDGRAEAGMGICVADFNADLLPDLFVTNFYQESNRLYQNSGPGQFQDVSSQWGLPALTLPVLGFGVQAADFNHDGLEDVLIANGHISDYSSQGQPYQMNPILLANTTDQKFQRVTAGPYFSEQFLGRGVAVWDYNSDGLSDAIIVHQDKPAAILKNTGNRQHTLAIRLVGMFSNRDAIGAAIQVTANGTTRRKWNVGSHGFMATNERVFRFATEYPSFDEIQILWPSGLTTSLKHQPANSSLVIREDGHWFTDRK